MQGPAYEPFSEGGGWPIVMPPTLQPDKVVRRRAQPEMLRHGDIYLLEPHTAIDKNTKVVEWEKWRAILKATVNQANQGFAGCPDCYLRNTVTAEIHLENCRNVAHNPYHEGETLEATVPVVETAAQGAAR